MESKIILFFVLLGIDTMNVIGQRRENPSMDLSQVEIPWISDCGGSGKLLKPVKLEGCSVTSNCKLNLNRSYNLSVPSFSPVKNYTDLVFIVSATNSTSNLTLFSNSVLGEFQENAMYGMSANVIIDNKFASLKDESWTIMTKIMSSSNEVIICNRIKAVMENDLPLLTVDCGNSNPYDACELESSVCLPASASNDFACRCDYSYIESVTLEGEKSCAGIIGTVCSSSKNFACIENAECELIESNDVPTCACKSEYEATSDYKECRSSSTSLTFYSLVSSFLPLVIVVWNSFNY